MREANRSGGAAGSRTFALVLAGGSGTRMAQLTNSADGRALPKQYWSLYSGRSLLGDALARARALVPAARTFVVVASEHREHWQRELRDHPRVNILVQPANRGTAAGLAFGVLSILTRDPAATILVLPSDHFVADEDALRPALAAALTRAARGHLVLLGIEPEVPETQYGWILPESLGRESAVRTFVEKPSLAQAEELHERGALWNSFLFAVQGRAWLQRVERRLPNLIAALHPPIARSDRAALESVYDTLPSHDFSREVLQGDERGLLVQRVPPCGWTDLGTPERVQQCLATLGPHAVPLHQSPSATPILARALSGARCAALA